MFVYFTKPYKTVVIDFSSEICQAIYYTCIQFACNFPTEETEIMEDLTSQGVTIIFEINMKY